MGDSPRPSQRPTQLSPTAKAVVLVLIFSSFFTGFLLSESLEQEEVEPGKAADTGVDKLQAAFENAGAEFETDDQPTTKGNEDPALIKPSGATVDWRAWHGLLSPAMAVMFGWILFQHARAGWRMRANLWTGLPLMIVFGGLIATGVLLQYPLMVMSHETWEQPGNLLRELHDLLGWLLLVGIIGHLIGAKLYRQKIEKSVDTENDSQ